MLSSPMSPLICLLSIFLGQMPSMISAQLTAGDDASSPSSSANSSQQFEKDLFEAAGLNFTRFNNETNEYFDKMVEMLCNNVTMTEEEQNELADRIFDMADENGDGQLTPEEISEAVIYLGVRFLKFFINQQNMTESERALILERMKVLAPQMRNDAKQGAIKDIETWDMDGDGKLNKMEAEEIIKVDNSFSYGKSKRTVDMKMAIENVMNGNEWK